MARAWLGYPRDFRLTEEIRESTAYISFGYDTNDITLTNWNGMMCLSNHISGDINVMLSFTMVCPKEFPKHAPVVKFEPTEFKNINKVCNKDFTLKSDFKWSENISLYDFLKEIYNKLNA